MRQLIALLVVATALFVPAASVAYTIVLKDGTVLVSREKYEVQGQHAVFTLLNGSQTSIPLAELDLEATEQQNVGKDLGSAVVLSNKGAERYRATTARPDRDRTLTDLIRERQSKPGDAGEQEDEPAALNVRTTAAGYPDLTSLRRTPITTDGRQNDISDMLMQGNIDQFRVYRGTRPEHVFVEVVASNEDEVFATLERLAKVALAVRQKYADLEGIEVLMTSKNRSRAAQFVLDGSNAPLLVNERMKVGDFFVEFVQF